jgi:cytidine deaminase
VMSEYENFQQKDIRIILQWKDNQVLISDSIDNLLPLKFSEKSFNL